MQELTIRTYREGDEEAILATFNLVFRQVCGEGYVDRGLEHWQWEFPQNPQGMRIHLAVTPKGLVAAQYAGVPMAVHLPWGRSSFVHAVDSMVHPDFRQGLKKPGLFVETGRAWFGHEAELGIESIVFGYPVRPAWRIGARFLGYSLVRKLDYLVAPAVDLDPAGAGVAGLEVEECRSFPRDEVDRLWREWIAGHECAVIRDFTYLDWRYTRCPSQEYVLFLARRAGRLVGWAVIHPNHELVPGAATFADWLLLPGEEEAGRALVAAVAGLARDRERSTLLAVLPPWSRDAAFLQGLGFAAVPSGDYLERRLGAFPLVEKVTNDWLMEHWYYTLGDSDLV